MSLVSICAGKVSLGSLDLRLLTHRLWLGVCQCVKLYIEV